VCAWVLSVYGEGAATLPKAPAPHSPQMLVETIARTTVTGRRADTVTAAFVASLGQRRVQVDMGEDGTVYVSNIRPAEVDNVPLVEDKGLSSCA
jgi:hypothetical protein